ncbi:MAG: tetratricopeptide repeat protein [Mangrovibacterium sp.]
MKRTIVMAGLVAGFSMFSAAQPAKVLKSDAISAEGQENYELAAENYEKAAKVFLEQNVTDTVCIYRAGYNYFRIKSYEKAVPLLKECISLGYNLSGCYRMLGDAREARGDHQQAETAFLKGRETVPEDEADFDRQLAYLYFNTGQYEKAAARFGRLDSISPGTADYMYLHGFSLERIHRYREAMDVLKRMEELFPDDKRAKKIYGVAFLGETEMRNEAEVKRYNSKKDAKLKDYIGTKKTLDRISVDYEKARVMLEASLQDFPGDRLVAASLYRAYKKQSNEAGMERMRKMLGKK